MREGFFVERKLASGGGIFPAGGEVSANTYMFAELFHRQRPELYLPGASRCGSGELRITPNEVTAVNNNYKTPAAPANLLANPEFIVQHYLELAGRHGF